MPAWDYMLRYSILDVVHGKDFSVPKQLGFQHRALIVQDEESKFYRG